MKKLAILFDLDGTLIDSTKAIVDSFAHSFTKNGYPKPQQNDITKLIGNPLNDMFASLGVAVRDLENVRQDYKQKYRLLAPKHTHLLPNAFEAVVYAKNFASLGVVTTKTSQYSKEILDLLNIGKYFDVIVGFDDVKKPKPDAEPILLALKSIKAHDEAWMIGDTHMDILSAQNASINSYAVLSGYEDKQSLEKYTKLIAPDALKAVTQIVTSSPTLT